jgi:hypothetical protein
LLLSIIVLLLLFYIIKIKNKLKKIVDFFKKFLILSIENKKMLDNPTRRVIMIKTRQNKGILYLLAVALMVAIMSIACKNKPTQAVSFSEAEDSTVVVDPTPTPEPTPEPTPTPEPEPVAPEKPAVPEKPISGLTIDPKGNLRQFDGFTFINKDGGIAKVGGVPYYMEIDGIRFYQGFGPACKGGSYVLLAGGDRADVKLFANGYVNITRNGKTVQYMLLSK